MNEKWDMRTGNGWAGSVQKKRRAHETHHGYKSRGSMYHIDFNVVKPLFLIAGKLASGGQGLTSPL